MATASKKAKAAKSGQRSRRERRFAPRPTMNAGVVKAFGGLGAAGLGAGVWAQFGHAWMNSEVPPYPSAPFALGLIAGGAVSCAAAVWLGTTGEPALRVGSGGIAIERGAELTRVPWYGVERIVWDTGGQSLSVAGTDEAGRDVRFVVSPKSQPAAAAWIVKEARDRIPDKVDVPEEAHGLPSAGANEGELLALDPVQVVGRRCAETDRIIAYEPDARVCPRCERVYHKAEVPESCLCGASLVNLRTAAE